MKLFPAKSYWASDMANSVTSQGDSALQPRSGLISFLCLPFSGELKRNPSLGTRLSALSPPRRFCIGCTMYLRLVFHESLSRFGSGMKLLGGRNKNRNPKGLVFSGG